MTRVGQAKTSPEKDGQQTTVTCQIWWECRATLESLETAPAHLFIGIPAGVPSEDKVTKLYLSLVKGTELAGPGKSPEKEPRELGLLSAVLHN